MLSCFKMKGILIMTLLELQNELYDLSVELHHYQATILLIDSADFINKTEHFPSLIRSLEILLRPIIAKSERLCNEAILNDSLNLWNSHTQNALACRSTTVGATFTAMSAGLRKSRCCSTVGDDLVSSRKLWIRHTLRVETSSTPTIICANNNFILLNTTTNTRHVSDF